MSAPADSRAANQKHGRRLTRRRACAQEKRPSMHRVFRYSLISSALAAQLLGVTGAFGQCENKSGFAKKVCEAQQSRTGTNGLPGFGDAKAVTTSFSDAIHLDTLAPSVDP